MAEVKVKNPLRLLSKLRRFGSGDDPSKFLGTEFRQNIKAIEDAFNNIKFDQSVVGSVFSIGPGITNDNTASGTFVQMQHIVSIQSDGSPISLNLSGNGTIFPFSVSTTSGCQFYLNRNINGADTLLSNHALSTSGVSRSDAPISWIDPDPPVGAIVYSVYARQTSAGTFTISNARLIAARL